MFSFYLNFSISMKVDETVTYLSLEVVLLGGSISVQSARVQWLGGRSRSEVSMDYIFPPCVLVITTLIVGRDEDGGATANARCEPALLCSVAVIILSGTGLGPEALKQSPEGWVQAGFISFKCACSPPGMEPLPQYRAM